MAVYGQLQIHEHGDAVVPGLDRVQVDNHYLSCLGRFLLSDYEGLASDFNQDIELKSARVSTSKFKALNLLSLVFSNAQITSEFINEIAENFEEQDEIAFELINLYEDIFENILMEEDNGKVQYLSESKVIDFYRFKDLLPTISIYFTEFLLRNFQPLNKGIYKVIEEVIFNDANFTFGGQNYYFKNHRLKAFYYRRLSQLDDCYREMIIF